MKLSPLGPLAGRYRRGSLRWTKPGPSPPLGAELPLEKRSTTAAVEAVTGDRCWLVRN